MSEKEREHVEGDQSGEHREDASALSFEQEQDVEHGEDDGQSETDDLYRCGDELVVQFGEDVDQRHMETYGEVIIILLTS